MTKIFSPQIITILENSQTTEDAISSLDYLITEHKEFLEVRIKSFEACIDLTLPISLIPTIYFAFSILSTEARKGYHRVFKDIQVSDNKIDYIYSHDGLNTLKAIFVPLAISSLHQTLSWSLQAIKHFTYDEELVSSSNQVIDCLKSMESSDNIIGICGNDGTYYISGEH